MLKFTSIVGYTSCGPTYIESFFTIFGQCINVLNYNSYYFVERFSFLGTRILVRVIDELLQEGLYHAKHLLLAGSRYASA